MGSYVKFFGNKTKHNRVRMKLEPGAPYRFGDGYFLLSFDRLESDQQSVLEYSPKVEYYDGKTFARGGVAKSGRVLFRTVSNDIFHRNLFFSLLVRAIEFSQDCRPVQAVIDVLPVGDFKKAG